MNHVKFNSRVGVMHKYTFPSFSALEEYFLNNIKRFKGYKTKVIGKTLFAWKN
jgi:hypothetical protein|tara:strand:+ start:677 stop:835 length:159 start_codon:yes stop_codon:yes gene_type:complete